MEITFHLCKNGLGNVVKATTVYCYTEQGSVLLRKIHPLKNTHLLFDMTSVIQANQKVCLNVYFPSEMFYHGVRFVAM